MKICRLLNCLNIYFKEVISHILKFPAIRSTKTEIISKIPDFDCTSKLFNF